LGGRLAEHRLSFEWRIAFILALSEAWHSVPLVGFAAQAADILLQNWTRSRVDFVPTLHLLAAFKDKNWVQQNGGIRIYRALLSRFLENLDFVHGTEWREILDFPNTALEWTEVDDGRLTAAFNQYRMSGVDDDISNCSSADQAAEPNSGTPWMRCKPNSASTSS
jgi:hypothetical protein